MTSLFRAVNTLLPFTNPSTPLWRDIFHTLVLCTFLYVAPSLHLERILDGVWRQSPEPTIIEEHDEAPMVQEVEEEIPALEQEPGVLGELDDVPPERPGEEFPAPGIEIPAGVDFQFPEQDQNQEEVEAGPANGQPARRRDPNREVGAKKAKSLARRNQQRAYNEFMREQGEAERAEWARDAAKREEELKAEKERRIAVETQILERERKARMQRKEKEERERREELEAARKAVDFITEALEESSAVRIEAVANYSKKSESWAGQLVKKEGVLGTKLVEGRTQITMLTGQGWVVRVDEAAMKEAYQRAANWTGKDDGKVSWEQFGRILQETLRDRYA
jgi:hypothetical protein